MPVPPRQVLADAIAHGNVVLIIGTGVSIQATGRADHASWPGLLNAGIDYAEFWAGKADIPEWGALQRKRLATPTLSNLLETATDIERALGAPNHANFVNFLRETIAKLAPVQHDLLNAIAALHRAGARLATTNYDDLLASATGLPAIPWTSATQVQSVLRGDDSAILHLHGHWRSPETIILGEPSYTRIRQAAHAQALQQAVALFRTVIFIGCGDGLADPNVGQLLHWLHGNIAAGTTRHILLCRTGEQARFRETYADHPHLAILPYGPNHEDLAGFLARITPAGTIPVSGSLPPLVPAPGLSEADLRRILREEIPALAADRHVPEAPLRAVLAKLNAADTPLAEIPTRLAEAADELLRLRADLARLSNDRPEFATLRARALAQIDQGEFDAARQTLQQGRAAARELRQHYSRAEAAFLADEARLHRLNLNHPAAIAAFAEAVTLDPDATWTWIELGDLHRLTGALAGATQAYTQARDAARRNGMDRDCAAALDRLTVVQIAQGNLNDARISAADALRIAQQLAFAVPTTADALRNLSVSHNKMGDIRLRQGDLQAALASYQAGLAITDRIATTAPGVVMAQRDLAVSHERIGNIYFTRGDITAALTSQLAAHAIHERISAAEPLSPAAQRDLSISHNKIGDIHRKQDNLPAALANYQAALAIRERLAATDSDNAEAQRDLFIAHSNIGDIHCSQYDFPAAAASYRSTLAIAARLAAADPDNAEAQRDLSIVHERIGDIQQDRYAALTSYVTALTIAERIVAADPANAEWQQDLARYLERVALANPDPAAALTLLHRGSDILSRLVALSPTNATYLKQLAALEAEIARRTP